MFGPLTSKSLIRHLRRPSFRVDGPNWLEAKSWKLELEGDTADSKCLENNSGGHLFFFFFFLRTHSRLTEVPRLGFASELPLGACTTATAH